MKNEGKVGQVSPAMAAFLISLPGSSRREATLDVLARVGITPEPVAADDGSSPAARHSYGAWRARLICGRALSPGEVGCFISHRIAATRFLETDAACGLVLEDDAAPQDAARATLDALLSRLPTEGWDMVNLGAAPGFLHRPVAVLDDGSAILRAHYFPMGSHAILWSRAGARRFLKATGHVTLPLDHFLRRWASRSGRGLALGNPPFGTRDVPSEIDSDPLRRQLCASCYYRMRRGLRRWHNKAFAAFRTHIPVMQRPVPAVTKNPDRIDVALPPP